MDEKGQSVTLKIANRDYSLTAASPEQEQLMRLAAKDVNDMYDKFNARFPETGTEDKFVFVAVQEAVGKFHTKALLAQMERELNALRQELESYLEGTEKR